MSTRLTFSTEPPKLNELHAVEAELQSLKEELACYEFSFISGKRWSERCMGVSIFGFLDPVRHRFSVDTVWPRHAEGAPCIGYGVSAAKAPSPRHLYPTGQTLSPVSRELLTVLPICHRILCARNEPQFLPFKLDSVILD